MQYRWRNGPGHDPFLVLLRGMAGDMMGADAVSNGRLVRPFDHSVDGPQGYWLVAAKGRRESRKPRAFREWLRREVPASVRGSVYQSRG